MSIRVFALLGEIAEVQRGFVTAKQCESVGVSRNQISRMAAGGALRNIMPGIYQMAGAPALMVEDEDAFALWLHFGGNNMAGRDSHEPQPVAAGITAASAHGLGVFWPDYFDFVLPKRKRTTLKGVQLRVMNLSEEEITLVDGMAVMTVERTIADLIDQNVDRSLVGHVIRDAVDKFVLVHPDRLIDHLDQVVDNGNGFGCANGRVLYDYLMAISDVRDERLVKWAA